MKTKPCTHWNSQRLGSVTLSVRPQPKTVYSVLQVKSTVDTGRARQRVILMNALPSYLEIDFPPAYAAERALILPRSIHHLDCVYTGRGFGMVTDVTETLKAVTGHAKLAAIVSDVVMTGDYILFRHRTKGLKFAGILRAIPSTKHKGLQCSTRF